MSQHDTTHIEQLTLDINDLEIKIANNEALSRTSAEIANRYKSILLQKKTQLELLTRLENLKP